MRDYRPPGADGWLLRVGAGLILCAIGAQLLYDVLVPLIPWILLLTAVGLIVLALLPRWRQ